MASARGSSTAREILKYVGGTLVVPQTVLVQTYWAEIRERFAAAGIVLAGERYLISTEGVAPRDVAQTIQALVSPTN